MDAERFTFLLVAIPTAVGFLDALTGGLIFGR